MDSDRLIWAAFCMGIAKGANPAMNDMVLMQTSVIALGLDITELTEIMEAIKRCTKEASDKEKYH